MTADELIARLWPGAIRPRDLDEVAVFIEEERQCDAEFISTLKRAVNRAAATDMPAYIPGLPSQGPNT